MVGRPSPALSTHCRRLIEDELECRDYYRLFARERDLDRLLSGPEKR